MMKKEKPSVSSYIKSREFKLDFVIVRTGEDTVEWTAIRGKTGQETIGINGSLGNVSSAVRKRGTIDEFAKYVERKLRRTYKTDPEFSCCEEEVRSCVRCMFTTKMV